MCASAVLGEMERLDESQTYSHHDRRKCFFLVLEGGGWVTRLTGRSEYLWSIFYCIFVRFCKCLVVQLHINGLCGLLCHASVMLVGWQRFGPLKGQAVTNNSALSSQSITKEYCICLF